MDRKGQIRWFPEPLPSLTKWLVSRGHLAAKGKARQVTMLKYLELKTRLQEFGCPGPHVTKMWPRCCLNALAGGLSLELLSCQHKRGQRSRLVCCTSLVLW